MKIQCVDIPIATSKEYAYLNIEHTSKNFTQQIYSVTSEIRTTLNCLCVLTIALLQDNNTIYAHEIGSLQNPKLSEAWSPCTKCPGDLLKSMYIWPLQSRNTDFEWNVQICTEKPCLPTHFMEVARGRG